MGRGDPRQVLTIGPAVRATVPLLVAPLLVVMSIALLKISNELVEIGPLDRASFGWLIPVPMLLLAPAFAGLATRSSGVRTGTAVLVILAIGLALIVGSTIGGDRAIGCPPVSGTVDTSAQSTFVGIVAGLGFLVAGLAAIRLRDRPPVAVVASLVIAIGAGAFSLLLFASVYGSMGACIPRPSP